MPGSHRKTPNDKLLLVAPLFFALVAAILLIVVSRMH